MAGAFLCFRDYFDSISEHEIPYVPIRRDRGKTSGIQIFAAVCVTTIALALSSSPAWPEPGQGGMLADAPTLGRRMWARKERWLSMVPRERFHSPFRYPKAWYLRS